MGLGARFHEGEWVRPYFTLPNRGADSTTQRCCSLVDCLKLIIDPNLLCFALRKTREFIIAAVTVESAQRIEKSAFQQILLPSVVEQNERYLQLKMFVDIGSA